MITIISVFDVCLNIQPQFNLFLCVCECVKFKITNLTARQYAFEVDFDSLKHSYNIFYLKIYMNFYEIYLRASVCVQMWACLVIWTDWRSYVITHWKHIRRIFLELYNFISKFKLTLNKHFCTFCCCCCFWICSICSIVGVYW